MANDHVTFAVLVPKSMTDLHPPDSDDGKTIVSADFREANTSDQSLGFDLAAFGELAWYTVQVVGPAANAVAYGIVANYLFDKFRQIGNTPKKFYLVVRLPSGRRIRFSTEDKELIDELQKEFEEQTM